MALWGFKDFPTSKIKILESNQIMIEHENKEIESNIISFGKKWRMSIQTLLKNDTIDFEINYKKGGKKGRESEKFWFLIKQPKLTVEEQARSKAEKAKKKQEGKQKIEAKKISEEQSKLDKSKMLSEQVRLMLKISPKRVKGGLQKTSLFEIFNEELISVVKLDRNVKFKTLLHWPLNKVSKILGVEHKYKKTKVGYIAEILLAWYNSILNFSETKTSGYSGLITNETTNVFFGVAPGLPQFVLKADGEQEFFGAFAIGIHIKFESFKSDDEGRVKPNSVRSPLPDYPRRDVASPYPIIINQENADDQIIAAITDDEGNLDPTKFPMSLVALKKTPLSKEGWDIEEKDEDRTRKKFLDKIERLSMTMGFEFVPEKATLTPQWRNTYEFLLTWCLIFKSNEPPEGIKVEKGAIYIGDFPLYTPVKARVGSNRDFNFCWFISARGRVHDAALKYLAKLWEKESKNRWLLLGDETGSGPELIKNDDIVLKQGGKKFAYIWTLIPPDTHPPTIASDFHAMHQHLFGEEHLVALSNIIETPDMGLTTVIFEVDNFVHTDQQLPRNNKSPSPSLIKATLPIMLEFIAQNTSQKNKKNCEIEVTTEQWGWHNWESTEPSKFLQNHGQIMLDNIERRGKGEFLIEAPPPVAKLDHPYLNYSDAVGFLVGDSLPKMLEEYKENLNEYIHVLPIYPTFLESEFPKLCEDLASKPLRFIESLIETNTQHVNAYFKFVLSGMVEHAWKQFKPLDWRQFNHLMERKQSTANGRKITAHLSNWIMPKLSQCLESLLSDSDRVNMCLTIAWSMDQQGGDVSQVIAYIFPEWLSTCPLDSQEKFALSLARVSFASRQNYFDFSTTTPELLNLGIIPEIIGSPGNLQKMLSNTNTLTENKASILGIFFSTFAFQNSTNPEHVESLWNTNSLLVGYPWEKARENRRHCIYGAEFAIDCAISSEDEYWFEQAKQRLFVDFDQYLSSGEDRRDEPFWWPVALKYHCLKAESSALSLTEKDVSEFLKKAKKVAREGPLPVRVRAVYWMGRLSRALNLSDGIEYFAELESYIESEEYPKHDVYGALLYVHLIDLKQRFGFESENNFAELFSVALNNSNESTRLHFSEFLQNPDSNIIESLCYNYL